MQGQQAEAGGEPEWDEAIQSQSCSGHMFPPERPCCLSLPKHQAFTHPRRAFLIQTTTDHSLPDLPGGCQFVRFSDKPEGLGYGARKTMDVCQSANMKTLLNQDRETWCCPNHRMLDGAGPFVSFI